MNDEIPSTGRRIGNIIILITALAGIVVALAFCWRHFGPPAQQQLFASQVDSLASAISSASYQHSTTPAEQVKASQTGKPAPGISDYFGVTAPDIIVSSDRTYTHLQIETGGRTACLTLDDITGAAATHTNTPCSGQLTRLR